MNGNGKRSDYITVGGMEIEIVRSRRKTLALQVQADGRVLARAPMRMSKERIAVFAHEKASWLRVHREKMKGRAQERKETGSILTESDRAACVNLALVRFSERVAYFAPLVGVTCGKITIRDQKTRWGSCSQAGNLNFNFRLVMAPPAVLDYVVVHELCHRREMNHSERFWREVARVMPDYAVHRAWLRENGWKLMG